VILPIFFLSSYSLTIVILSIWLHILIILSFYSIDAYARASLQF